MTATKIIQFPGGHTTPAAPPAAEAASGAGPRLVTFRAPFDLPGLAAPHRPGTYELRETRRSLDVSWDAWQISLTLMLVDGGTTQALDVTAADLEAALARDAAG